MLSREDNEMLVRTGPGTPMGELMRRFWAPVALESELGGPDSAPVRVHVLGEKFVMFRDSAGEIGLLDAYCPHRRANLFWGRNEERGLRCVYHGWKFDVHGQCTDLPNCPEGEQLAPRVKMRAFPARAVGGIVWAYFGPPDKQPEFPHYLSFPQPESHRFMRKIVHRGNYLQLLEGDIDSSHVSFLHSRLDDKPLPGSRANPNTFADKSPRWFPVESDYGLMLSAQRDAGPEQFQWRVNQYLMPFVTLIAAPAGCAILNQVRIPIDDEHSLHFRCFVHPDRPLTAEEIAVFEEGVIMPDVDRQTFEMVERMENEYLIDRDDQRTTTYTGIKSIVAQDLAVVQEQGEGLIADRSLEYLVSSDRAIIMVRKKLLTAAKNLQNGIEPPEVAGAKSYAVRPGDFLLPRDVPPAEGAKDLLFAGAAR